MDLYNDTILLKKIQNCEDKLNKVHSTGIGRALMRDMTHSQVQHDASHMCIHICVHTSDVRESV